MAPEMCAKQVHHWTPPTCSAGQGSARVIEIKKVGYCLWLTNIRTARDPGIPSEWQLLLEALPIAQQIDPNQIYKLKSKPQMDRQDWPAGFGNAGSRLCALVRAKPHASLCSELTGDDNAAFLLGLLKTQWSEWTRQREAWSMGSHCYSPNPGSSMSLPLGTLVSSHVRWGLS